MQAIGGQPQRAPDGAQVQYERHRPEQTTLYRLVQQHAATFIAEAEAAAGADLPQFVKDEFNAFPECGILAHGFLRLRCGDRGHHKLVAFSCKQRGFCQSCGARRMAQTAAHLVDHVILAVNRRVSTAHYCANNFCSRANSASAASGTSSISARVSAANF